MKKITMSLVALVLAGSLHAQTAEVTTKISVQAVTASVCKVEPAGLNFVFGEIEVGSSVTSEVEITNEGTMPCQLNAIQFTGVSTGLSVTLKRGPIGGAGTPFVVGDTAAPEEVLTITLVWTAQASGEQGYSAELQWDEPATQ